MAERMIKHGTLTGYTYHGCRCAACTDANRRHFAAWRARHRGQEPQTHGWTGYTNYGCRCGVCVEAMRARSRAQYAKRRAPR